MDLVQRLRASSCHCVVTGGLACVEFGIAEHTSDCDILCQPGQVDLLLSFLSNLKCHDHPCRFRGNMSAPLAAPWLEGGWTAHFTWGEEAFLDVFGAPPRVSRPWWNEENSLFASRSTVAKMKRTRRFKDWAQATALGLQMLEQGQNDGWYHLFDSELLTALCRNGLVPENIIEARPVLRLAQDGSPLLSRAVKTEIEFWVELDRLRLGVFKDAARAYAAKVRSDRTMGDESILEQNQKRLIYAQELLPSTPITPKVATSLVEQAREIIGLGLDPKFLDYLPQINSDFDYGGSHGER